MLTHERDLADCRYCHLAFGPAILLNDASGIATCPMGGPPRLRSLQPASERFRSKFWELVSGGLVSALPFRPLAFPRMPQALPHPLGRHTSGLLLVPTPRVFSLHETDPDR